MKLDRKKMLLISFMLFSLFFGAGNLIFPPHFASSFPHLRDFSFFALQS